MILQKYSSIVEYAQTFRVTYSCKMNNLLPAISCIISKNYMIS